MTCLCSPDARRSTRTCSKPSHEVAVAHSARPNAMQHCSGPYAASADGAALQKAYSAPLLAGGGSPSVPNMHKSPAHHSALLLMHGLHSCAQRRPQLGAAAQPAPTAGSSCAHRRKLRIIAAQSTANAREGARTGGMDCVVRFKVGLRRTLSYLTGLARGAGAYGVTF